VIQQQKEADAKQAALAQAAKDKAAKSALEVDAKKALAAKMAKEEELKKAFIAKQMKVAALTQALDQGQKAMLAKNYVEAMKAFETALRLEPEQALAKQGLQQAQSALAAAKIADENKSKQVAELKKTPKVEPAKKNPPDDAAKKKAAEERVQYQNLMTKGQQLLKQNQFAEAAQQFEAALKLVPNDPLATKMLQQAKKLKK
jgi:outer membrane protein assembly factor BamD (BamD/ComL family)